MRFKIHYMTHVLSFKGLIRDAVDKWTLAQQMFKREPNYIFSQFSTIRMFRIWNFFKTSTKKDDNRSALFDS